MKSQSNKKKFTFSILVEENELTGHFQYLALKVREHLLFAKHGFYKAKPFRT